MATDADVVLRLLEKTESGEIKWQAKKWDKDGTPNRWVARVSGCRFSLMSGRLDILLNGESGWRSIHPDLTKLLVAVRSNKEGGLTLDEVLNITLTCLEGKED